MFVSWDQCNSRLYCHDIFCEVEYCPQKNHSSMILCKFYRFGFICGDFQATGGGQKQCCLRLPSMYNYEQCKSLLPKSLCMQKNTLHVGMFYVCLFVTFTCIQSIILLLIYKTSK